VLTEILNQDLAACGIRGYPTFHIGDTLHFVLRYPFLLKISVPGQAGVLVFCCRSSRSWIRDTGQRTGIVFRERGRRWHAAWKSGTHVRTGLSIADQSEPDQLL